MFWRKFDKNKAIHRVQPAYHRINEHLHGSLDVFRLAGKSFSAQRAPEAAASMAYFTLFSLFPLIVFLVSFASFVLKSQFIQDQVLLFISNLIPVSPDIIVNNIENILIKRGIAGWLAALGLIWSATSMFNILTLNVDRAWSDQRPHNFLQRRLIGIVIIAGLTILLLALWGFRTILNVELVEYLLQYFQVPIFKTTLYDILAFIMLRVFRFIIFWVIYLWIPRAKVRPSEAFWGALFSLVMTDIITHALNWYITSNWVRYEIIYGSLGRIIALLLWIYFSSYVILFGAHVSSAVGKIFKLRSDFPSKSEYQ